MLIHRAKQRRLAKIEAQAPTEIKTEPVALPKVAKTIKKTKEESVNGK